MSSATVLRGLISTISSSGNKSETDEAAASSCADVADELLMLRIQSGDRQALGVLYDRYAALILSVGLRILRDANEAQELVQDVFLYVFESNQQYDCSKGQLRSWLVQIAYSRAFNKRQYLSLRGFYDCRDIEEILDTLPSRLSPELCGELSELRQLLQTAFAGLTELQRTTLQMFFWEGYSLREISIRLQETLGNTRNHYYRGLEKLRGAIKVSLALSHNGRK